MRKRILCMLLAGMLVIGLTACSSSGSSTEVGTADVEEGDSTASETEDEMEKAEDASDAEEGGQADGAGANDAAVEEVDQYGFTESQKNQLFACIAESISTNYLEPNGMEASDFIWPEVEGDSIIWRYFNTIMESWIINDGETYDDAYMIYPEAVPEDMKQLMKSVMDGIDTWHNMPENSDINVHAVHDLVSPEALPEKVHFE